MNNLRNQLKISRVTKIYMIFTYLSQQTNVAA